MNPSTNPLELTCVQCTPRHTRPIPRRPPPITVLSRIVSHHIAGPPMRRPDGQLHIGSPRQDPPTPSMGVFLFIFTRRRSSRVVLNFNERAKRRTNDDRHPRLSLTPPSLQDTHSVEEKSPPALVRDRIPGSALLFYFIVSYVFLFFCCSCCAALCRQTPIHQHSAYIAAQLCATVIATNSPRSGYDAKTVQLSLTYFVAHIPRAGIEVDPPFARLPLTILHWASPFAISSHPGLTRPPLTESHHPYRQSR